MRPGRALAPAIALLALSFAPREARAIERQHHLGLGPTLATLVVDDKKTPSIGAGLALHYTYGLDDQFNLMAEVSSAIVARDQQQDAPTSPRTRPATADQATAGVGYVIDILQWVPYLGLLGGVYRLGGGTLARDVFLPGLEIGVGLDYQLSRRWAVGLAGRQHVFLSKLSTYPSYTTVQLRVEYMWGY